MSLDDLSDPRAFRWVESGVSGLARPREWDATAIVELADLEDAAEFTFTCRADGTIDAPIGAQVSREVLEGLAVKFDAVLARPFGVRAVRQARTDWMLAAKELKARDLFLPARLDAHSLEVVVSPDLERFAYVDGELASDDLPPMLVRALEELERRGGERFESFVARADKVEGDRWDLTIDPL